MNKVERWKFLTPLALAVLFIAAMVGGAWANEFAGTTNIAVQKPNILIGNNATKGSTAGNIVINESAAGALSATPPSNTFYIKLPPGVCFVGRPKARVDNNATTTLRLASNATTADGDLATANATMYGTESCNDTAEWAVNATSTSNSTATNSTEAAKIRITNIRYAVSSTVAEGDIDVTIDSEDPGNPGLTPGTVANAKATASGLIVNASAKKNVEINSGGSNIGSIVVTEAVAGACAAGKTITLTLPTGVTWNSYNAINATVVSNGGNWTSTNATDATGTRTVTINCVKATTLGPGQYKFTGVTVNATSAVPEGDINLTVGGTAGFTSTVAIASAKHSGVTASALLTTLPTVSQGSLNTYVSGIKLLENFSGDIDENGTAGYDIKVTLPAGVTFAENLGTGTPFSATKGLKIGSSNLGAAIESDTTGLGFFTVNATGSSNSTSTVTLNGATATNKFKVNVADSVPVGDLDATVEVALSTDPKTTKTYTVKLANVVAAGATVTKVYTGTTPDVGTSATYIHTTGSELQVKIAESNPGAIPTGSTITVALSGATFDSSTPPSITAYGGNGLAASIPNGVLSSGNTVATFTTTGASTASGGYFIIDLKQIKTGAVEGSVVATVTVRGIATDLTMANVLYSTQSEVVGSPTSLNIGQVAQATADMRITEQFKNALNPAGEFRLVLSGGLSFASAPIVTYTVGTASPVSLNATLAQTFVANDTVDVNLWGTARTGSAIIDISDVYLNVPPTAGNGQVVVQVADGNTTNANACGIRPAYMTVAYVGQVPTVCDADHLDLCTTEAECTGAGLNWCNGACQVATCGGPIAPPTTHTVGACNDTSTAPVKVANGKMNVNFNYDAPVEVIVGVMDTGFTSVEWLNSSCALQTDYTQAATNAQNLSCSGVLLPSNALDHGWVFWLVAPTANANMGSDAWWTSGAYELSWYKY